MASAQVLPNSRKQEHLEAGKRRLEEFRKKRAADRAKKTASATQPSDSSFGLSGKQTEKSENVRTNDLNGARTSDGPIKDVARAVDSVNYSQNKEYDYSQKSEGSSVNYVHANSPLPKYDSTASSADLMQNANNLEINRSNFSAFTMPIDVNYLRESKEKDNDSETYGGNQGGHTYSSTSSQSAALHSHASQDFDRSSSRSNLDGIEESNSKNNIGSVKEFSGNPGFSFGSNSSPQNSSSIQLQNEPNGSNMPVNGLEYYSFYRDSARDVGNNLVNNSTVSDTRGKELNGPVGHMSSMYSGDVQPSQSLSFSFDATSPPNHVPVYSAADESYPRRSRRSFLDDLNVSRVSSGSPFQQNVQGEPSFSTASKLPNVDSVESNASDKPSVGSGTQEPLSKHGTSDSHSAFETSSSYKLSAKDGDNHSSSKVNHIGLDRKPEFFMPKQNEDFAALEQHIEDLTQEKFSLQRALEASRVLAESLATENSSLTDSYNQQRSVVEQLKSDMEQLQQEIRAQLVELESIKMEYANVQLECNAADERAKLLASEVISLEEKALRLRSNELKLERELENSQAEVLSYKKKLSSLEKDRQDLQSTIAALQEEKVLLQSKLRKASATGKSSESLKSPVKKKDMSTSTDDLDDVADPFDQIHSAAFPVEHSASSSLLPSEIGQSTLQPSLLSIPSDQMRTIQNINSLITELALEKEDLMKALASESSMSSKLKELNKELSRKLEVQTQRLELLTSQSMASDNIQTRLPEAQAVFNETAYADEGDEVVERVLGWIMKLFPGGPSRRRTSKLITP